MISYSVVMSPIVPGRYSDGHLLSLPEQAASGDEEAARILKQLHDSEFTESSN